MAGEEEVIKSYVASIGFKLDESSLRKLGEGFKQTDTHLKRFSENTQRSTTLWQKFFEQFQRSAGPQRDHIDIAQRLGKAYEIIGLNLKSLATLAGGGTIASAFISLTSTFNNLWVAARQAGTSVQDLQNALYAGERVGVPGAAMQAAITNLNRALTEHPGMARALQGQLSAISGIRTQLTGVDPAQATDNLLRAMGRLYQMGDAQRAMANDIARQAGIDLAPFLPILRDPALMRDFLGGRQRGRTIDERILGPNATQRIQEFTDRSHELVNQWQEFLKVTQDIEVELAGPFVTKATNALKTIENGVAAFAHALNDAKTSWESLRALFQSPFKPGFPGFGGELPGGTPYGPPTEGPGGGTTGQGNWLFRFRNWLFRQFGGAGGTGVQEGGLGMLGLPNLFGGGDTPTLLSDWLRGSGGFIPSVRIANVEDFIGFGMDGTEAGGAGGFGRRRHGDPLGFSAGAPTHLSQASAAHFREMADYITKTYGYDQPHIRAMLANMLGESGGRAEQIGDFGTSIGLFQHHNERARALMAYLAQRGTDIHNWRAQIDYAIQDQLRRDPGWFAPGEAPYLTGRWEKGYEAPRHLTGRLGDLAAIDRALGGGAALGTHNTYHSGDRTVTLNSQNNFTINGGDGLTTGGAIGSVIDRTNADLIRNLSPVIR